MVTDLLIHFRRHIAHNMSNKDFRFEQSDRTLTIFHRGTRLIRVLNVSARNRKEILSYDYSNSISLFELSNSLYKSGTIQAPEFVEWLKQANYKKYE